MAKIVLRLLGAGFLLVNLIIILLSYISGVNIYQKYGTQIIKTVGIFLLMVIAFYVALGLIGMR